MAKYWVGGTGNWSDTTHWSASSGGSGSAGVPTSTDDVIFDSLSNATAYTVTVNATANMRDLTMAGPLVGAVTWTGGNQMNIYGSYNFSGGTSGITASFFGTIVMSATSGTKTMTTNGITLLCAFEFNGTGGTFQLADNFTLNNASFTRSNGTFDGNGKKVSLTNIGTVFLSGTFTFFDLDVIPSSGVKTTVLSISANQTVTGTLTITGNSAINRLLVKSNTLGTARTITAAAITIDKVDFQDITGAGAASWDMSAAAGYTGDCGGNSMKALGTAAFTAAATCDWSSGSTWSTATWSNHSIPLPQDTATFTTAGTVTITQNMPRIGSVDFSTVSGAKTWTTSTTCSVFGSINLTNLTTLTASAQEYTFEGRGSTSITSAGKDWQKSISVSVVNGTLTLADDYLSTYTGISSTLNHNSGTLTASGNVTLSRAFNSSNSNTRTINLGSGTWTVSSSSSDTVWQVTTATNLTLNAGTSTIKLVGLDAGTLVFNGGGKTYNNFWNATTGTTIGRITGSHTFKDFKSDAARTNKFAAGSTQHVTTFTVNGTAGNEVVLDSSTTATYALVKDGGGTITCDYLNIQHCVATPATTWLATNSTNNQATATAGSGWFFGAFPVVTGNFLAFF